MFAENKLKIKKDTVLAQEKVKLTDQRDQFLWYTFNTCEIELNKGNFQELM